jgi:hypothetical protein
MNKFYWDLDFLMGANASSQLYMGSSLRGQVEDDKCLGRVRSICFPMRVCVQRTQLTVKNLGWTLNF